MALAIIPAKGASVGVPYKNTKTLGTTPLIVWTIDAAQGSRLVTQVVVITDSEEIGKLARGMGVYVLEEPRYLAAAHVQVDTVAYLALLQADHELDRETETVVVLQPTSPFRSAGQITEAIELFEIDRIGSVMSVLSSRKFPYAASGGYMVPLNHDPARRLGRKDYDTDDMLMFENGSIYVVSANDLVLERTFRVSPIAPYVMSDLTSLEIDTQLDWITAEAIADEIGFSGVNNGDSG